jgi:hypothetical protein
MPRVRADAEPTLRFCAGFHGQFDEAEERSLSACYQRLFHRLRLLQMIFERRPRLL